MKKATCPFCGREATHYIMFNGKAVGCIDIKQTNADRIRAMTDEELAEFLDRWELGDIDYAKTFCDLCKGQYDCHNDCLMDWLKQEAKDE